MSDKSVSGIYIATAAGGPMSSHGSVSIKAGKVLREIVISRRRVKTGRVTEGNQISKSRS